MASTRIPVYHVAGTHYECAHTVGKLTREAIRHRIADDFAYLSTLFAFVQTDYGLKLHRDFIDTIRSLYPWYWDELRGIADGSEMPLEQILVLNFLNETRTAYRIHEEKRQSLEKEPQIENETGEKGCTTVLLNRKDTGLLSLLHNEDHSTALYMTGYLVEADIHPTAYDDGKRHSPKEKFLAYCYAGAIPGRSSLPGLPWAISSVSGNAFGANSHGFACSLNGLYPNFVAYGRLPRQIVNRALLSVKDEDDLDRLLQVSPVAYGFSINGGFFHQLSHLFNYEIGPNLKMPNENYISKCRVVSTEESGENDQDYSVKLNYLIHYNHYERLDNVIVQQKSLESTYSRWRRGQELGEIVDIDDALRFLGDNENEAFPIFRVPNRTDVNSVTLCTVHINFRTLELSVYQHNPKEDQQPSLVYNLAELFGWYQGTSEFLHFFSFSFYFSLLKHTETSNVSLVLERTTRVSFVRMQLSNANKWRNLIANKSIYRHVYLCFMLHDWLF